MVDELGTYIDLPHLSDAAHRISGSWGDVLRADPCSYCGRTSDLTLKQRHGHFITVDHIDPRINGGRYGFSINGTASCKQCNSRKGAMKLIHWLNRLAWKRDSDARATNRTNRRYLSDEQVELLNRLHPGENPSGLV